MVLWPSPNGRTPLSQVAYKLMPDCSGIPPGDTFLYEFPMSEQWGTYWVHAHASVSVALPSYHVDF